MRYARPIHRLMQLIPEDMPCPPGCVYCCNKHRWTWTEWWSVRDKRVAFEVEGKCPYAGNNGCEVYEQRPLICRLYGTCDVPIGDYKGAKNVTLACPFGVLPEYPLHRRTARKIFKEYMKIIEWEDCDALNSGVCLLPAGPFGPFIRPEAGVVVLDD